MTDWLNNYIANQNECHINSSAPFLVEMAIKGDYGHFSAGGALVVKSGKFTGRAVKDKYIVEDDYSRKVIDWERNGPPLSQKNYQGIKNEVLAHLNSDQRTLYIMERSVGADQDFSLGVRVTSTSPIHALFARYIFRSPMNTPSLGHFTILHAPSLELSHEGLRSSTAIIINFGLKEIIIFGTSYCGEIKKSIFSVMNTLLPDMGILPMHTGASVDQNGRSSLFFGLSGTGKTTLSTDVGMQVIGDDEHGLSDRGVFNFEGGCYAKTYGLNEDSEPQIFRASTGFASLLENVVLSDDGSLMFNDKTITENGRATYPLTRLESVVSDGKGEIPSHIFFLSADALGVLPAISLLNHEQAMYYFLTGYTAKLAGTEVGLKGITTTFSHCFGAPFMMRRSTDYGELLKSFLSRHRIKVWLVNTGWYGGPYGIGKRYDLSFTRSCIRAVQKGQGEEASFENDPIFGLRVPIELGTAMKGMLNPKKLWKDPAEYEKAAWDLKSNFDDNYSKMTGKSR